MPAPPGASPLLTAHAAAHRLLDDQVFFVLEALVQKDLPRARKIWDDVVTTLYEHMAWEEEHVIPTYARVAPADGPGRADHVAGDHKILVRVAEIVNDALLSLEALEVPTLRAILEELPKVYRVQNTLEHHTLREQNNVYPALDRELPKTAVDDVISGLEALVKRASSRHA